MIKRDITIELAKGLEARPVAVFVQVASQYNCSIIVSTAKNESMQKYHGNDEPRHCAGGKSDS